MGERGAGVPPGPAQPTSTTACLELLVFLGKDGGVWYLHSPDWLAAGKLSQGTGVSTELGAPQITAAQRAQILEDCSAFEPGSREHTTPTSSSIFCIIPLVLSMPQDTHLSQELLARGTVPGRAIFQVIPLGSAWGSQQPQPRLLSRIKPGTSCLPASSQLLYISLQLVVNGPSFQLFGIRLALTLPMPHRTCWDPAAMRRADRIIESQNSLD